jgi:hypothetical protein
MRRGFELYPAASDKMKVIEDITLELLLVDTQIKFVDEALGHEIGSYQVLIHITGVRRREAESVSSGMWVCACRCRIAHRYPSDMR